MGSSGSVVQALAGSTCSQRKGREGWHTAGQCPPMPAWELCRELASILVPLIHSCVTLGKSLTLSVFQSPGLTDGNSGGIGLSERVLRECHEVIHAKKRDKSPQQPGTGKALQITAAIINQAGSSLRGEPEVVAGVRGEDIVLCEVRGHSTWLLGQGTLMARFRSEGPGLKACTANSHPVSERRSYLGPPLSLLPAAYCLHTGLWHCLLGGACHSPSVFWSFWEAVAAMVSCEPTSCYPAEWSQ